LSLRDASNSAGDIEIVCTGLRPGEKLYEELPGAGVGGAAARAVAAD
jgi:FlaA1/EpsC-like NDP-sugar epimerase